MRISDWSSDVCSADLLSCRPSNGKPFIINVDMAGGTRTSTATFCFYARHISVPRRFHDRHTGLNFDGMLGAIELEESNLGHLFCTHHTYSHYTGKTDRQSVVKGKSVSVIVTSGG